MRRAFYATLTAIIVVFCGCSSGNDSATILDASGKHPSGWVVQANGGAHPGLYFSQPESCAQCHGKDLNGIGGTSKVSCSEPDYNGFTCHPYGLGHAPGWDAAERHGAKAKAPVGGNNGMGFCRNCHGPDYNGAGQSPSCLNCHGAPSPHPQATQWRSAASPPQVAYTHTNTDASNAQACSQCHNASAKNLAQPYQARFVPAGSFNGSAPGCYNGSMCHANIIATSNCTVCHGIQTSGVFSSLSGITSPTNAKVGAHAKHYAPSISSPIACQQCHPVPATYQKSPPHRDSTTDFIFGALATNNGTLTPTVTGAFTCTNIYCHGVTLAGGSNKTPRWNDTAYNTGCATCHGYPPPAPHFQNTNCSGCHPEVNSSNNGFTPSGVTLHINGKIEASGVGHVFPYPGALHSTAGAVRANCSGCHDTTTPGGSYPVASGIPPFCSGCHLNMTNFLGASPGCWDCHGSSATNGRPNGGSFPNRQGRHQKDDHASSANNCTTCHPYSSGSPSHGWSNRTKSAFAQVNPALGWVPGSRINSGYCSSAGCHGAEKFPWYP